LIVADTGAIIALIDADDRHHRQLRGLFEKDPDAWVLPWAILPEVDYLVGSFLGPHGEEAFLARRRKRRHPRSTRGRLRECLLCAHEILTDRHAMGASEGTGGTVAAPSVPGRLRHFQEPFASESELAIALRIGQEPEHVGDRNASLARTSAGSAHPAVGGADAGKLV